jgi:deoxyribodipyrimidine photolyase-related protein
MRHLVVVLGDQLDRHSPALADIDAGKDAVWMAECAAEATHVWSHKARIALFLSAMRHFRDALRDEGLTVHYTELDPASEFGLIAMLEQDLERLQPRKVLVVEPGEWRLREALLDLRRRLEGRIEVALREDTHFLCPRADFEHWMQGRRQPRMEHFYRRMRREHDILMQDDGTPVGGQWNFDHDNRSAFGRDGPPSDLPDHLGFEPDALTREVLTTVQDAFSRHPGSLEHFDWPVTRAQALDALEDFVAHRLPCFGRWQDAMWDGLPPRRGALYHARLSAALNLKLLGPREVCEAACRALKRGDAPIEAVEGFVRQILGWREYVRGLYWQRMPEHARDNALDTHVALPDFYWTGDTDMHCLRASLRDTLETGYAHHIQRLMVTGLYTLLLGVEPSQVHAWYLAIYVDAVEWVELPNVIGMSQWADGGIMASKPYIASGKYIQRMSNYCANCRFRPDDTTGPRACPVSVLYWDFLDRHRERFAEHPRMKLQVRNLQRRDAQEMQRIREQARTLRGE